MLTFKPSQNFTLGAELEIQIINCISHDLKPFAGNLLKQFAVDNMHKKRITPEVTQSMLEINTSIHNNAHELLKELFAIRDYLNQQIKEQNIYLAGGGTHPFQMWNRRKIYPKPHYEMLAEKYGYLAKMFTVFGLHIHIGCANADESIYLAHAMSRFIPHFITLSASSPFCQGIDTGFDSSRANVVTSFPLSGLLPIVANWHEFSTYIEKMQNLRIIERIEDFYWDIRPRPEFGTIEIRVCDAPLTLEKIALLTAFAQTLVRYCLLEKPFIPQHDNYHLYRYNRFQASRYGYKGIYIDQTTLKEKTIKQDLLDTCNKIAKHAEELGNTEYMAALAEIIDDERNDAKWLRDLFENGKSLKDIVYLQSELWTQSQLH